MDHLLARAYPEWFAGTGVNRTTHHQRLSRGRRAFITAALDTGVPLRDVQEATSHADPRTPMRHARARTSLDQHATYNIAAHATGAAR
jgi:hypothetical protein